LLSGAVGGIDHTVNGLLGDEGPIQELLNALSFSGIEIDLGGLVSIINLDLGSPQLNAQVGLEGLVDGLIGEALVSESGVTTIDLESGQIYLDLEQLHGGGLNDLAPNTELLSPEEINQITQEVTNLLGELLNSVTSAVETAIEQTSVTLTLTPDISAVAG